MIEATDTGYTYRTLGEAVQIVKRVLEDDLPRDRPERVAQHARIFSADSFEEQVRKIVEQRLSSQKIHLG